MPPIEDQPATISTRLGERLLERGAEVAVVWDDTELTYQQFDAWSAALAAELGRRGVDAGDRVAIGLPNGPLLIAAILAVLRRGAVLVPLNPSGPAGDAAYAVTHSQARIAVLSAGVRDRWGDVGAATLTPDDQPIGAGAVSPWAERGAGDPALLMYTSGTTGRPKGVVLSQSALAVNLATVARAWRWNEHDRLLLTLPCFHLHGLGLGILGSLLVGSRIVLRERFVATEVPALIETHRCTLFFGVPTMYNRLVQLPGGELASSDLTSMRLWVSGSAPLTPATFEAFRSRFGHEILERFGMSEGGFMIAVPFDGPRRPGVVGIALPGIEVRIVDPEAKQPSADALAEVGPGQVGEIAIRGPNLFSGYWRDQPATEAAFRGTYFRSGDLATREADGMIRIVGRISVDIIKCRGFKVAAIEIENCIQALPGVAEVAVVGVPHPDLGEEIVAVVTPRADTELSEETVLDHTRRALARHKVPARIVFSPEIPRTGPGKFKKRELIDRLTRASRGSHRSS